MKFACYTLGCKVNQYETQAMEQLLMQSGHTLGSFDEICDGYIINTCTVTAVSDKKSRNAIRRVRKLNPNAVVGVCGCYAQSSPDEIRKSAKWRAWRSAIVAIISRSSGSSSPSMS